MTTTRTLLNGLPSEARAGLHRQLPQLHVEVAGELLPAHPHRPAHQVRAFRRLSFGAPPVSPAPLQGEAAEHGRLPDARPLDDRAALEQVLPERPHGSPERDRYVNYPGSAAVPEQSGVVTNSRSCAIAADVDVESSDAEGVPCAHGGVAGGHSLYVKGHRLYCAYDWIGATLQVVDADREISPGKHVLTAEFAANGRSTDPAMPCAVGTLTLYMDDQEVGGKDITTQPGSFCAVRDGFCVGRDGASPVTPDRQGPFSFTGGMIDRVVVDVSGERHVGHDAPARGWLMLD